MDHTVQPGRLIGGRYELIEPIGGGGFGRVWKARDQRLQTNVAVKELSLPSSASPSEREERLKRSEREVLNAARLRDHPNIVSVHDVVIEDDIPWIAMRLVVGHSLAERLRVSGPLTAREATDVARAMLRGLDAAHQAGIVHRDIKPANVMLADSGEILLTDFGIATHESDTPLTLRGGLVGSAPYMAPERVHGERGHAPSDLFSLGVLLYEALEGTSPFNRGSQPASLHAVAYDEPPVPVRAGPLRPLIARLLAKAPGARPTIGEALALLDQPPAVLPPPHPTITPPPVITTPAVPRPSASLPTATALTPPARARTRSGTSAGPPGDAPGAGGHRAPAPDRGPAKKWVGWSALTLALALALALALGSCVVVLVVVNQGKSGTGEGTFSATEPVTIADLTSVESRIEVAGVGGQAPESLGVTVDISHPWASDLRMELVAPDGTAFELRPDDVPYAYVVDASEAVADGDWTLRIEDTAASDEGALNTWSLDFGPDQPIEPGPLERGSFDGPGSLAIEDLSVVSSEIEVEGLGGDASESLGVTVDISHPWASDLRMELVAPDDTAFELEPDDEPRVYTVDASDVVADGTWTLRIEDTAAGDEGTLNSWSLDF
ncbi:protein kinase [Streptomyces sp. DSM 44915]|uniref:non-specific serine/threonine protein kinase n=1 Tax=Streptomyces chisholmiae TaxID=3075540 RepID=A0ABU2JMC0_9ACTN|nr:protein kinase [Streptomyces sp. DSM 44915]MDT0265873.1 protein kinase [Streptomyces sp. DSM 44915]